MGILSYIHVISSIIVNIIELLMNDLYPAIAVACEVLVSGGFLQPWARSDAVGTRSFVALFPLNLL